ncbi:MAG: CdaR family protein [Eubacteriales bacterium]|nr:CdaR family protein [Eubacteriales bacterium]
MKEKILTWLSHNFLLKLLSVVMAFGLWLAVTNISNPEIKVNYKVPIEVRNENYLRTLNKKYELDTKFVNVSFNVRTMQRNQVKPADFTVFINLSDYSVTGAVPVYIEVSNNASSITKNVTTDPMILHISAEEIVSKTFNVKAEINGVPAEGFYTGGLSFNNNTVTVTGPASKISLIQEAYFDVNIDGATENVSGVSEIRFHDLSGKRITDLSEISYEKNVSFVMEIFKSKALTVRAVANGSPAAGYMLDGIEVSPTFISVYGPDTALMNNTYVLIPRSEIDISGLTESRTMFIDLKQFLPEGLKATSESTEVTVLIKIRNIADIQAAANNDRSPVVIIQPQPTVPPTTVAPTESTTTNENVDPSNPEGESSEGESEGESSEEETEGVTEESSEEESSEEETEPEGEGETEESTEASNS